MQNSFGSIYPTTSLPYELDLSDFSSYFKSSPIKVPTTAIDFQLFNTLTPTKTESILVGPSQRSAVLFSPRRSSSSSVPTTTTTDWSPVPDLIPDSPSSLSPPNNALPIHTSTSIPRRLVNYNHPMMLHLPELPEFIVRSSSDFRSASVPPLGEIPKPRRRRTQEWSEQDSFVSSVYGQAPAGANPSSATMVGVPQHLQPSPAGFGSNVEHSAYPFAPNDGVSMGGPNSPPFYTPSVDHPLSLPEQQDLLDRVKRDLNGIDLDSIKGPLRALALSGGASDRSNAQLQFKSPGGGRSMMNNSASPSTSVSGGPKEEDELAGKTVSPQEAFLDYEDVDHRLHAGSRLGNNITSSFGLGVGSSLFAPLPQPTSPATRQNLSPASMAAASHDPTRNSPRTSPPSITNGSSTSPRQNGSIPLFPRKPHPFAVPQNAVSWAERSSSSSSRLDGPPLTTDDYERESSEGEADDDIEFSSASIKKPEESTSVQPFPPNPQSLRTAAAALFDSDDEEEQNAIDGSEHVEVNENLESGANADDDGMPGSFDTTIGQFDEDHPQEELQSTPTRPGKVPVAVQQAIETTLSKPTSSSSTVETKLTEVETASNSAAVRPEALVNRTAVGPDARLEWAKPASYPVRDSALRANEALRKDAAALVAQEDEEEEEQVAEKEDEEKRKIQQSPEVNETDSVVSRTATSRRGPRTHTKRAAPPPESEHDDEDTAESVDDASFHDSDDTHAPRNGRRAARTGAGPNKRRRRVPTAGATIATENSSLSCSHILPDGSICGVVFRRPYDLARHRETIHGDGGKAGKKHDWICKQCGGSFSRKDALIRHGRIRNHKSGV